MKHIQKSWTPKSIQSWESKSQSTLFPSSTKTHPRWTRKRTLISWSSLWAPGNAEHDETGTAMRTCWTQGNRYEFCLTDTERLQTVWAWATAIATASQLQEETQEPDTSRRGYWVPLCQWRGWIFGVLRLHGVWEANVWQHKGGHVAVTYL